MEHEFWHQRWANNDIGFHEAAANPLLTQYIHRLQLHRNARIFVPLCGKTRDIHWLLSQGYQVVGAELNEMAVQQLFSELEQEPKVQEFDDLTHYHSDNMDIYVGDIFQLSGTTLGSVDAIYDRAALVALPESMRQTYAKHLMDITHTAPQLLICFEYDQSIMDGPPFSISETLVSRYYQQHYQLSQLSRTEVKDGLKKQYPAEEVVWLLEKQ